VAARGAFLRGEARQRTANQQRDRLSRLKSPAFRRVEDANVVSFAPRPLPLDGGANMVATVLGVRRKASANNFLPGFCVGFRPGVRMPGQSGRSGAAS
jgi:hypothetical protein